MLLKKREKAIFPKLSLTISLLVFVILFLTASIGSWISAAEIKKETCESNLLILSKISRLMENELSVINKNIIQFCNANINNNNVAYAINDFYERGVIRKKILNELMNHYEYINSVYIFYNHGRNVFIMDVVNKVDCIMETGSFTDGIWYDIYSEGGKIPRIFGMRTLYNDYPSRNNTEDRSSQVISFIKGIPVFSFNTSDAIMVNMDIKHFTNLINADYMPMKGILLISDQSDGSVLLMCQSSDNDVDFQEPDIEKITGLYGSSNKPFFASSIKIGNRGYYASVLKSDTGGRIYSLIIPEEEMFKSIYTISRTIILFSFVLLLIGIIFSMIIDKKFFQPVIDILIKLKTRHGNESPRIYEKPAKSYGIVKLNEFKQINGYLDDIMKKNMIQEQQLKNYFSFYRERVMLSLLNGDVESYRMMDKDILIFKPNMKYFSTAILYCAKKGDEPAEIDYRAVLDSFAMELSNNLHGIADIEKIIINHQKAVLLFCMEDKKDFQMLNDSIRKAIDRRENENVCYIVSIGCLCNSVQAISNSYKEAEKVFKKHASSLISGIYDIDSEIDNNTESFSYPVDIETKIIRDMNANNPESLVENIKGFYNYMRKYNLQLPRVRKYSFVLIYNIFKHFEKDYKDNPLLTENIFADINSMESISEIEEWMTESLVGCLAGMNPATSIDNKELIEKVMKFIETHYMEEIGLNTIADYVYLSPSYLGKIFKEASGYTFTDYLIKVRMEAAARLLIDKNINISDIVRKVGYFSAQSFCRMFKNYYKCSPGEYRKRNIGKILEN